MFQVLYINPNFVENQKLEPETSEGIDTKVLIINVVIIVLGILSIVFLVIAGATEPGIIPRIPDPSANLPYVYKQMLFKQEQKHKYLLNKRLLFRTLQGPFEDEPEITINGQKEGGSNEE